MVGEGASLLYTPVLLIIDCLSSFTTAVKHAGGGSTFSYHLPRTNVHFSVSVNIITFEMHHRCEMLDPLPLVVCIIPRLCSLTGRESKIVSYGSCLMERDIRTLPAD